MDFVIWEGQFAQFLDVQMEGDAAHDLSHIRRVLANAKRFAQVEGADLAVVIPAAWLHDCVTVPKDSAKRPFASKMAADTAVTYLQKIGYPTQYHEGIAHAIAAHSFSAQIPCKTIEAKVVQDADRIDAIGAIGIARCFMIGGLMGRIIYNEDDPFCTTRQPDDSVATIDHFYTKLFKLETTMQTNAGRHEAHARTEYMRDFLAQVGCEIGIQ